MQLHRVPLLGSVRMSTAMASPLPSASLTTEGRSRAEQLDALTSLRFFAAMHVVLFHYHGIFPWSLPQSQLIALGFTGVTFFFVLSGFILAHTYAQTDFRSSDLRTRYLWARVGRIFPVYLVSLAISLPFLMLELARMPDGLMHVLQASSMLLAPIGLHAWVPGAAGALNPPSWSISAELFFYLLLPFILPHVLRRPIAWGAGVAVYWLLVTIAAAATWRAVAGASSIFPHHDDTSHALVAQLLKHLPLLRLPEFILGIVGYALWSRYRSRITQSHALLAIGFALAAALLLIPLVPEIALHNGLTSIIWLPMIIWAAGQRGGVLQLPFLVHLGRISFALYLLHVPVGLAISESNQLLGWNAFQMWPTASVLFGIGLSLSLSAVVFTWLEEPARRAIVAWGRSPTREPATSSSWAATARSRGTP